MKSIIIMKVGSTFDDIKAKYGDFDEWTSAGLSGTELNIRCIDAENGEQLPPSDECASVIVTGSHSMVTNNLAWSVKLEDWLKNMTDNEVPILGICYGHQLLARALGGSVGFHPKGKELGTVYINLTESGEKDTLFNAIPSQFLAHTTHYQSVLTLPEGADLLAFNEYEPHHAFRLKNAWGVQFHPEFSADLLREYIIKESDKFISEGLDVPKIIDELQDTPISAQVLTNFVAITRQYLSEN